MNEELVPPLVEYAVQYHNGQTWRFAIISSTGERVLYDTPEQALAERDRLTEDNPTPGVRYRVVGRQVTPWMEVEA